MSGRHPRDSPSKPSSFDKRRDAQELAVGVLIIVAVAIYQWIRKVKA